MMGLPAVAACLLITACNKEPSAPVPIAQPVQLTTPTLATLLDGAEFTYLKAAVVRAGLLPNLSVPTLRFTVFAPDNNAFILSGIPTIDSINKLPLATVVGLVSYHIIPQTVTAASITTKFPNFQYPSIINPNPAASALLRLSIFPSKRGANAWVNNIPVITLDMAAVNGVAHKISRLVNPPAAFLWNKIAADPNLLLLKTAIERADQDPAAVGFLQGVLGTNQAVAIGASFTVFAPDTTAFKNTLAVLSGGALSPAAPNANFVAFINTLPIATVKGIVVYHVLGSRAFGVNFPATATSVPTLLNSNIATHPGLSLTATQANVPGFGLAAVAATVKGVINATPANITSQDNHYINGTLHVINQVLLPQ